MLRNALDLRTAFAARSEAGSEEVAKPSSMIRACRSVRWEIESWEGSERNLDK